MIATAAIPQSLAEDAAPMIPWKLWIYTNYDCNLRCDYCVARSSPNAPRRAIGLANANQLVDEAVALGFEHIFFTGGEPFILPDIYAMLAYSSARVPTTVLTNAMLLRGPRLEKLTAGGLRAMVTEVIKELMPAKTATADSAGGAPDIKAQVAHELAALKAREDRAERDSKLDALLAAQDAGSTPPATPETPPKEVRRVHKIMGWGE